LVLGFGLSSSKSLWTTIYLADLSCGWTTVAPVAFMMVCT
jgi:hypothetical protein